MRTANGMTGASNEKKVWLSIHSRLQNLFDVDHFNDKRASPIVAIGGGPYIERSVL